MIAFCPICHQPARLPEHDAQALECPNCLATFQTTAASLPRFRQLSMFSSVSNTVVDDDQPISEVAESGEIDQQLTSYEPLLKVPAGNEPTSETEYELQSIEESTNEPVEVPKFSLEPRTPVRRRREKSMLGTMVGVVFGGLLALPIATAILWYAKGIDPFKVAPAVARYVPWIVPDRLAGNSFPRYQSSSPSPSEHIDLKKDSSAPSVGASYFTDETLKNEQTKFELSESPETASNADLSNSAAEVEELASSESMPEEEETKAVELPFRPDVENSEVSEEKQLALQNVLQSFDDVLQSPIDQNLTVLFDQLQRFASVRVQNERTADVVMSQQLNDELNRLKSSNFVRQVVSFSRARLEKAAELNGTIHIDGFALKEVAPLDDRQALSEFSGDYEKWLPSEMTKEPLKSMLVLAPKANSEELQSSGKKQFILLGRVIQIDGIEQPVFVIMANVPL